MPKANKPQPSRTYTGSLKFTREGKTEVIWVKVHAITEFLHGTDDWHCTFEVTYLGTTHKSRSLDLNRQVVDTRRFTAALQTALETMPAPLNTLNIKNLGGFRPEKIK
jgi:hypothetical protein